MTAILVFRVEGEGTVVDAVDMLNLEFRDVLEELGDRLTVVQEKDTPLGVDAPAFVALEIEMFSLTRELLDDLKPLFRFMKVLLEKYTENTISATVRFSDGAIEEAYAL